MLKYILKREAVVKFSCRSLSPLLLCSVTVLAKSPVVPIYCRIRKHDCSIR